jgi:hypothetical protein
MMDASVPWDCNFISWNTAFCAYPCVVSRDSTSGLYTELEMISDMYLGRKLIPHHPSSALRPHPWIVEFTPIDDHHDFEMFLNRI